VAVIWRRLPHGLPTLGTIARRLTGVTRDASLRRLPFLLAVAIFRFVRQRTPLNFDVRYGVDTQGRIEVEDLHVTGHAPTDRCWYEPSSPKHVAFATGLVPGPLAAWSFVDVGSGKGRVVLAAMAHPFHSVVGVELVPELHAIAEANVSRYRGPRRCRSVELICGDATSFALPKGDVVVFFYNSFRGDLLRRLLDHLEDSCRHSSRRLVFVYSNPTEPEAFTQHPAFERIFDGESPVDRVWRTNRRLIVYALDPGLAVDAGGHPRPSSTPGVPASDRSPLTSN
jgi:SAM-dependent methyltransferase